MTEYKFEINKNHITCRVMLEDITISTCILSVDVKTCKWEVSFWHTQEGYKHSGYGKSSMKQALCKALEIYGMPEHIHYIWNGANEYVLNWMEKHFDAVCSCPLVVQKTQADDDRESHIYILDVEKVFEYFDITIKQ